MLRFLLNRIALLIPTFIGVTIAAFAFIRLLPGDSVIAYTDGAFEARNAALDHSGRIHRGPAPAKLRPDGVGPARILRQLAEVARQYVSEVVIRGL